MRVSLLGFLSLFVWGDALAKEAALLKVADSINPGTADYIVRGISDAEAVASPYLIIELDTPGGLLTSTRTIVQKMLNSKIPIVVFIAPKGAHAGSAGALITLAADVAVMAPGTNMGAAHPVTPGAEKIDKAMDEKITNDVAAFAESLARAKGRNQAWAAKSVRKSASIIADEALREGVIDLIAEDREELIKKLTGFRLRVAKGDITALPSDQATLREIGMSLKHRIVSFFSDPNLAYMIMSLGGLCIWVELTHPGLIFPGVLGAICILLSLIAFQLMPIHYGALFFVLLGMGLIIAEVYVTSYGVLGIAGILSFVLGSIFLMDTEIPEFRISPLVIYPTSLVLISASLLLGYVLMKSRRLRLISGPVGLVGETGEVRDVVSNQPGKVLVQGELWNAVSLEGSEITTGSIVVVTEVRNMLLVVRLRSA